jgi:hypothetical protein
MSKQIILDALESQYATKQSEAAQYELTVYNPALIELGKSISEWFSNELNINPHQIKFRHDDLEITPSSSDNESLSIAVNRWPATIDIKKRRSYSGDEKETYYEINYVSSNSKVNEKHIHYLTMLGQIAQHSSTIISKIESEWDVMASNILKPYYELTTDLRKLEHEVFAIRQEIYNANREKFKVAGFEHTISPQLSCERNWEENGYVYELKEIPKIFQLETGRGKWDYINVNAYRVIGAAKYNKTAIQIKKSSDSQQWIDMEVKNDYFDSFVHNVYVWETEDKQRRNNSETARYNDYLKLVAVS